MNILIKPSLATGSINAPPSKSYAHRLLICAALANGESIISNVELNDDITATINCLEALGAEIEINNKSVRIKGIKRSDKLKSSELFCNESGSTLRFLIPISLVFSEKTLFKGKGRLLERPQSVYDELFEKIGCFLEKSESGLICGGELKSGCFELRGDVSSQFITGLLFTLPLLNGDSEIILTTPLESTPYIDITIDALSRFGVEITKTEKGYYVKGNQTFKPRNFAVEGDWSNAAFLDAFNLLGGAVRVEGLNKKSFQGDKAYKGFYEQLKIGCPDIDITDCPDLAPVLIACASLLNGARFTGTSRLKIKESDRGEAMKAELKKFGVDVIVNDNEIIVPDSQLKTPGEPLYCHNDHRIAMALSVVCSRVGGILLNPQCVNKSYPEFFDDIKTLGIQYDVI